MCTCNLQWRTKVTLTLHLKLNLNNSWQQMLIIYKFSQRPSLYCQFSHRHHNFKFWIVLCENCKQICIHCKALHCYKRINSHEYAKQPSTTMIRTKASSIWFYILHLHAQQIQLYPPYQLLSTTKLKYCYQSW